MVWRICETERCNHKSVCYLSTMSRATDSSTHSTVRLLMFQSRGRGHNLRQIQWVSQSVRQTRLMVPVHGGIFLHVRACDASQLLTTNYTFWQPGTHTHWLHLIGWMPLANVFGHIVLYWNERQRGWSSAPPSWILMVWNVFLKTI